MDVLLVFPPGWPPTMPYLSLPLLAGAVENAGYSAAILDLNIRLYNFLLHDNELKKVLEKNKHLIASDNIGDRTNYKSIAQSIAIGSSIIQRVPEFIKVLQSGDFYNPKNYKIALLGLNEAFRFYSNVWSPISISLFEFRDLGKNWEFNYPNFMLHPIDDFLNKELRLFSIPRIVGLGATSECLNPYPLSRPIFALYLV